MEALSTLISDGVDMNAILHEVCISTSCCVSVLMYVIMHDSYTHNVARAKSECSGMTVANSRNQQTGSYFNLKNQWVHNKGSETKKFCL